MILWGYFMTVEDRVVIIAEVSIVIISLEHRFFKLRT